ncbi:MAG: DUF2125 domain-containing protein [Pseudomonadota bacterium]
MKKTLILLVLLSTIGAAWSWGWYFVAGKVEETLVQAKARLEDRDKNLRCTNQAISGFPFRISVTCDSVTYSDNRRNLLFEAGELRSAAQAYQPGKAIIELDAPSIITMNQTDRFDVSWNTMRASMKAGFGGVEKFSAVGTTIRLDSEGSSRDSVDISELQMHGRKVNVNDVDLALVSEKVISIGGLWPNFDLKVNLRFDDIYDILSRNPDLLGIARKQGLAGELTHLDYMPENGGRVIIKGPLEINTKGELSGRFDVTVSELKKLVNSLSLAFPDHKKTFREAELAAGLLSAVTGGSEIKIPVTVVRGEAIVGLIPIGKIPTVF